MRKKRWNPMIIIVCIVAITGFAESMTYYGSYSIGILEQLQRSIASTVFIFTLEPGFFPSNMFLESSGSLGEQIRYYWYSLILVVGPMCTATAVWNLISQFFATNLGRMKYKASTPILIFGYNEEVRAIIENEQKDSGSKIVFHIFTNDEISKEQELNLLEKKVILHRGDFGGLDSDRIDSLKHSVPWKKIQKILLFEDSDSKNVSLYFTLAKLAEFEEENVAFYVYIRNQQMRNLLKDFHDQKEQKGTDNITPNRRIHIVNIEELILRDVFEKRPIHHKNFEEKDLWNPNVNILMIGWDSLMQQAILHALNEGVLSDKSRISIDIVAPNIEEEKMEFLDTLAERYRDFSKLNEEIDGEVVVRYHEKAKVTKQFVKELDEKYKFTYIFISTGEPQKNLSYLFALNDYFNDKYEYKFNTPIVTMLDEGIDTSEYLRGNKATYKNVLIMKSVREMLTFGNVCDERMERRQMEYHSKYCDISDGKKGGRKTFDEMLKDWVALKYDDKESNRYLEYHQDTKEKLLDNKGLDFNELCSLEHRRWCYFKILRGWSYGEKRDNLRKQNENIIGYDKLNDELLDKAKQYDSIPYQMVLDESKK